MTKWLKGTALAGVAVATVGLLAGCAGAAPVDEGPVEISFMALGSGEITTAYDNVVEAFEEANPNITVNAEYFATEEYDTILKTRLSGGAGPDVFLLDVGNRDDFIADGFLADLAGRGDVYLSTLTPAAAEESARAGANYSVPISFTGGGIVYNAAIFEEVGITEEPQTYSELLEVSEKLLAAGKIPFAMSAQDSWFPQFIFFYALTEHGSAEHGFDGSLGDAMTAGEATFSDSDAWATSLDIVGELTPYYMPNPVGTSYQAAKTAFLTGEAAMLPATFILPDARAAEMDLGFMNFRTMDEDSDAIWGGFDRQLAVNPNNGEANLEASHKFLEFFLQDEPYEQFLTDLRVFPTTLTAEVSEEADALFPDMQASWEGKKFPAAFSPVDPSIQDALLIGLQNIISGEKTSEQVIADMDVALEQLLARNG